MTYPSRRGGRADGAVRAMTTYDVVRSGRELPAADPVRRAANGDARPFQPRRIGCRPADHPRLEEVELDGRGEASALRLVGERVDLELEGVPGLAARQVRVPHVARLVIGDDDPVLRLVHAVISSADDVVAQAEGERPLHGGR